MRLPLRACCAPAVPANVTDQTKQAIYRGMQMSLWDGSAFEVDAYNRLVSTEDRREGCWPTTKAES
jgi:hypothetical protein